MGNAIDTIDDRVLVLDTTKLDKSVANTMVRDVTMNTNTGVITITYLSGSTATIDTKLEKLAVNFTYDAQNQRLVITLDDGSVQYVDMSALITQYEFIDSTTMAFTVDANGRVTANVKNGSITAEKLQPNYLADVTAQAGIATQKAADAGAYAGDAMASSQSAYNSEISAAGSAEIATEKTGIATQQAAEALASQIAAANSAVDALTAQEAAEQAADDATDMVADVLHRLEIGAFNGPQGIQGPKGDKGEILKRGELSFIFFPIFI